MQYCEKVAHDAGDMALWYGGHSASATSSLVIMGQIFKKSLTQRKFFRHILDEQFIVDDVS